MSEDKLAKVKAGVSGNGAEVEVELSKEVPGVLASLFPTTALRSKTRQAVSGHIFGKLNAGQTLDEADLEYLDTLLKPAEAKWIRQKAICERAAKILEESPARLVLPPRRADKHNENDLPDDDWRTKFWGDAGLVSHETLREIYARILVAEATKPGSCSMRTLKAIRYLDPKTAKLFAKLIPLAYSFHWIPMESKLLEKHGIQHASLLEPNDAELLNLTSLTVTPKNEPSYYNWGKTLIRFDNMKGVPISCYVLTSAVQELARVAEVERDPAYLADTAQLLKRQRADVRVFSAQRPDSAEDIPMDTLTWTEI